MAGILSPPGAMAWSQAAIGHSVDRSFLAGEAPRLRAVAAPPVLLPCSPSTVPSAALVSCSLSNCFTRSRMILQGLMTLMAVSSAAAAAASIYLPAQCHVSKSKAAPSDTSSPWLSHHFIKASKARLSCLIPLLVKIRDHTWSVGSSQTDAHTPISPSGVCKWTHTAFPVPCCTLQCPQHSPLLTVFSACSFLCCPHLCRGLKRQNTT